MTQPDLTPFPAQRQAAAGGIVLVSVLLGMLTWAALRQSGVGGLDISGFLILCAGWLVVVVSGVLAQKLVAPFLEDAHFTFALAAGVVLASLAVLVLCEALQVSAATAFLLFGIVVLGLSLWRYRDYRFSVGKSDVSALLPVACCATFVLVWMWNSLDSVGHMMEKGSVSLWADCFIHATSILQYSEFRTLSRGSFEFVDTARPLYHYGSFVLPATVFQIADISGLQAMAAVQIPIGLLAMFAGTHALTVRVALPRQARTAGCLAICLLFVLPDTANYGLANGWFGVRWILLSHPGSGFAIAGVLISLIFLKEWLDQRSRLALAAAAVFAAMVFELRAHMLLWYLPALAICWLLGEAWALEKIRRYRGLLIVATLALLPFVSIGNYLWFVHSLNEPTGYSGVYLKVVTMFGRELSAPLGIALLYAGMLGVFALAYPLLLAHAHFKAHTPRLFDWFPMILAGAAGLIIVLAPASPSGDPYEFKHRAFVLLYVVALIWTCCLALEWLVGRFSSVLAGWFAAGTVLTFLFLAIVQSDQFLNSDRPKFKWGHQYVDTPIPRDLIAAADYLRRHAKPTDAAIVLPVDPEARAADDATRLAAIGNTPMYFSRVTMWKPVVVGPRLKIAGEIGNAASLSEASAKAKANGIRWLVMKNGIAPGFDPAFQGAVFRQGDWAIFPLD